MRDAVDVQALWPTGNLILVETPTPCPAGKFVWQGVAWNIPATGLVATQVGAASLHPFVFRFIVNMSTVDTLVSVACDIHYVGDVSSSV